MSLALSAVLLAASLSSAPHAAEAQGSLPHAALLHGAQEHTLQRALVPSDRDAHGEVRLVRRGEARCAETILCSPILLRGLQAIRRKERAAWPAGVPGHEDSERFLAALDVAQAAALEDFARRKDGADSRRKLLIELVDGGGKPATTFFAFYTIDVSTEQGRLDVTRATPIIVQDASPEYVTRAMRLQTGEAFKLGSDALEKLFNAP